ncbi:MAG: ATP synthase F1 subunit gamma [Clostridia bacterium]|nr:ATP synthase F1 subunit gamma [Clostridia bacterium]
MGGADIKRLRTRIRSVDSTLHLTKAMELVASSKMRKAADAMDKSIAYADAAIEIINVLAACRDTEKSVYFRENGTGITRLFVIAGDRGLAGGYNANIFRLTREYPDAEIIPIGKRACERYGREVISSETVNSSELLEMAKEQCRDFSDGKFDRLGIVCTKYVSIMTQEATVRWVFPLERNDDNKLPGIIFEPDEISVLESAVPEYVCGILSAAVRESFACEIAARRTAMDSAGKNARDMIDNLTLRYNRARQSAITQEITEIVAGGNAQ